MQSQENHANHSTNSDWTTKVEAGVANALTTFLDESRKTGNIFQGFDAVLNKTPVRFIESLLFVQNSLNEDNGVPKLSKGDFISLCKEQILSDPTVAKALDSQGTMTGSILRTAIKKFSL
jgi:hypothetical protein